MNLTNQEKAILKSLADAWNLWCALDGRKEHDDVEFQTAIHLAQQKIALRVAKRVDPDIWRQ